jgi:hypothetical protein
MIKTGFCINVPKTKNGVRKVQMLNVCNKLVRWDSQCFGHRTCSQKEHQIDWRKELHVLEYSIPFEGRGSMYLLWRTMQN